MSAHARLGPSSAEAWMTCPGYPNAVEGLHDPTSEYAAEGTAAHAIADDCLFMGLDAADMIGSFLTIEEKDENDNVVQSFRFEWTEEDAEQLQYGLDEIRAFEGEFFGEHRVDLSEVYGVPGQFGTLDRGVVGKDLIVVGDLKWGRGIPVSPVENKQLMIYALGFWYNIARHRTKAKDFLFIIDQPRCPGGGGHWRCTLDELLAFRDELRIAAPKTLDPNAPRVASEKGCFWCRRRQQPPSEPGAVSGCKTYDEFVLEAVGSKFDEIDEDRMFGDHIPLASYDELGAARRTYIVKNRKMIEKWLEGLHAAVIQDGLNGESIPGLKVVDGRKGRRTWVDEKKADAFLAQQLGEDRFTIKLKSVAQAVKAIPADRRHLLADSDLFIEGTPKPVLVDEKDARPAKKTVDEKFEDVESDTL